jgi:hypothetical protein
MPQYFLHYVNGYARVVTVADFIVWTPFRHEVAGLYCIVPTPNPYTVPFRGY